MKTSVKMDVDSVDGRRPTSTRWSTSTSRIAQWSTSTSRKPQSGRRRPVEKSQSGRRRPVENVVDGRRFRADVFITPFINGLLQIKMQNIFRKLIICLLTNNQGASIVTSTQNH